ncbi:hypothetical protein TD95_005457 [Thielaviopsis punctulata]|uniref:Uncharacterized protein n=1 Tax=Thielaviopsis punctulata TaxID=72032 RepID=A0A0F4ZH89_9PEZI|nr:hypothetical protein TD95_005457 [Thielaviopsis punctulata]
MATAFLAGTGFGAATVVSGVVQPQVIIGQFQFQDWHMLSTFLTATGSSAIVVAALDHIGYTRQTPRSPSPIGFFAYDGNFLGGAFLGTGMALTGSCPGTVFAQVGASAPLALYTLTGSLIGGVLFTGIMNPALTKLKQRLLPATPAPGSKKLTLAEVLGASPATGALGFAAATIGMAVSLSRIFPASPYAHGVSPILGGLLIGMSQLFSALLRKALLGVSGSFEEFGKTVVSVVSGGKRPLPVAYNNSIFAFGVVMGAMAVARMVPSLGGVVGSADVTPASALLGGTLMVIGARMAGGCTSGHGISGMSMLSLSSFVTIGTAFATAGLLWSVVFA